ncbi:hypothetical protein [Micromonospora inyonensis]|uniref:Uncharacterized protein n=1 Tax=Micromonospora inyonensis TaxID=47866 RepID=A0A1C6RJQ8_9ACTN|nr:hypothetical protein [Micromonospora inyonensis]SCL17404.1 hypothetical protein GA0074694_1993 [Micromonospora inyonensis]
MINRRNQTDLRRMQAAGVTTTAGTYSKGSARSGDLPGHATSAAATAPG